MADTLFDFVSEKLAQRTDIERLASRGTLRLALKQAGLSPKTVSAEQIKIVLEKILPNELTTRGVDDAAGICRLLVQDVASAPGTLCDASEYVDDVFRRLGGDE